MGSAFRKRVQALLRFPPTADFSDVVAVLEYFEFQKVDSGGTSHNVYRHADGRQLTVPTVSGRKVKVVYVKKMAELIRLEEWNAEQDDE